MGRLLEDLYSGAIVEHNRRPRNRGVPDSYDVAQAGLNPGCGDELTLYLALGGERLTTVMFEGEGCAISQAAASLLTQAIRGATVQDAAAMVASFKQMMRGAAPDAALGDSRVLQGVAKLPARVKCATLPWVTLELALQRLTAVDGKAEED